MPAVILDAGTLASAALYRDTPARQLLILLSYGSACAYLGVGYAQEQHFLGWEAEVQTIGRADPMIQRLQERRLALASALPHDAPEDYWLVASEALEREARDLIYEEIQGNTDLWDRIDLPTWHRMLAASDDLIGREDLSLATRVLAPLLARMGGLQRTALEVAIRTPQAHIVLRHGRPSAVPGADAALSRLGIQPALVKSLDEFLSNPPWSMTGFDLRSIDPTL